MMRENESDGAGDWWQPPEEDAGTRRPDPDAAPRPDSDYPDTLAFGTPAGSPGYGSQASYGPAWHGGQSGYPPQGQGGGGAPGWAAPDPPPGRRGPWGGRLLVYVAVAALAAGIGAGVTVAFGGHRAAPAAGVSSNDVPGPHDNASGSGASAAPLNPETVRKKVDPGLVDIMSNLKYNGETAEGTGMIISASGLVLTNNHVIDQSTSVRVNLATSDNQYFSAKVLGYDAADDVALLQLQGASGLTPVRFGNSSQVRLGTPVLALGNAEGHGGARPAPGIINALDRSIQASDEGSNSTENLHHMLQTNAKIEQGDSGGALANNAGQVIGMITAANTSTPGQSSSGSTLGFAIPINSALAIARRIAAGQASSTVYIGTPGFLGVVAAQSNSPDPRRQAFDEQQLARGGRGGPGGNGAACLAPGQPPRSVPASIAPVSTGTLILGTLCRGAVAGDGLAPGDVIISVDGQAVTTPSSLTNITARYHPGTVVSLTWAGVNGLRHTTSVTLGSGPAR